jgi:hypothetical protein
MITFLVRCGLTVGWLTIGLRADDFVPPTLAPAEVQPAYDVVVAGAGTGGIGAAIQAARLGASVLLLEETDWVGGQMLAAAVSAIDEGGAGNLVRGRGLYRELVERVDAFYRPLGLNPYVVGRHNNLRLEPRVGRRMVHAMLAEAGRGPGRLDLVLRARVVKVHRTGTTVTGAEVEIVTAAGRATRPVASRVLIDATEWGDVLPLAGVRYRSGNRTSDSPDPARLIQENTWTAVVRRYPGGVPADLRLTAPPPGYERMREHFASRIVPGDAPHRRGQPMSAQAFLEYRGMPDSAPAAGGGLTRTHLNYSNDHPCSVAYLEDPAQRTATDRAMRLRTLQLLYFVQHELGLADWSVADDEGFDSPYNRAEIDAWLRAEPALAPYRKILYHFSALPYVRESRRLVGRHTLTAREISRGPGRRPFQFPTAIALGDYRLDLHGGRGRADLELDLDRVEDLEDAKPGLAGPFAIPLECLVPEITDGFLAAEKNYSQSRLVNGATRMQPHTLNVGQAAGALAALAVRHGVPPRRIDPVLVQRAVLAAQSALHVTPFADVAPDGADWPALQLAAVRGWLALEEGKLHPARPLRAEEWRTAWAQLGAGEPPGSEGATTVTRAAFARALEVAARPEVELVFRGTEAAGAAPITRSEAAQVLAEFQETRALARLRGGKLTLAWAAVRPASPPPAAVPATATGRDLQRLVAARVLPDAGYWSEHAVADKECDGARVAELLGQAARVFEPQAEPAAAIDVLLRAGVIASREYWSKGAVPGGRCAGRNVAALLRNLAQHPEVARRGAR